VQSGEAGVARNAQSTPDRRLNAGQQDVKLTNWTGHRRPIISQPTGGPEHAELSCRVGLFQGTPLNRQPSIFPGLQET
jgi:hypothetical protein